MDWLERLYLQRDPVAWAAGGLVLLGALMIRTIPVHPAPVPDVTLLASVALPSAPPPPPRPVVAAPVVPAPPSPPAPSAGPATPPRPAVPSAAPVANDALAPRATEPSGEPARVPPAPAEGVAAAPANRSEPVRAEPVRPVVREPLRPAAPPPPVEAMPPAAPGVQQAGYESQVLAYLEKIKRYPTSREARQSHPTGTVRVWLELSRSGQVLAAGVLASSGSNLLDNEALRSVRAGTYPPFPDSAFAGEASHRFAAGLKYEIGDGS